jgi:hypothetical protein
LQGCKNVIDILLNEPFTHQPEGIWSQDYRNDKKPYDIPEAALKFAKGCRAAYVHKVIEGCEKGNLQGKRGEGIDRKKDA